MPNKFVLTVVRKFRFRQVNLFVACGNAKCVSCNKQRCWDIVTRYRICWTQFYADSVRAGRTGACELWYHWVRIMWCARARTHTHTHTHTQSCCKFLSLNFRWQYILSPPSPPLHYTLCSPVAHIYPYTLITLYTLLRFQFFLYLSQTHITHASSPSIYRFLQFSLYNIHFHSCNILLLQSLVQAKEFLPVLVK